jgi:NitT/TauT family transport system substrate-binding protein
MPTNQTPQALASGSVAAIAAWQPNSGQALKEVPGSSPIFTSANAPGLIYDLLYVSPESLAKRKEEWKKVVKVWFRVVDFIKDEKNKPEYLKIMSARVGLKPEAYEPLMKGTHFLDMAENKTHFADSKELSSVYGSSKVVDEFNVRNAVYKKAQDVASYLDGSLIDAKPAASK